MDFISRLFAEVRGGDEDLAHAAVGEIAALGRSVLPEIERMLGDDREEERWWAVRILAEMDLPAVHALLRNALDDEAPSVRQAAALALRNRPDPEALPYLVKLLEADEALTRRLAGEALIALGSEGVPTLVEIVQNGAIPAQVEAARSLAKIVDKRAIPILYGVLDHESALLTHWAEEGLEAMGVGMIYFKAS